MSREASLDMLLSAARHGNAEAQYALGGRYRLGDGVEPDLLVARQWLLQAAEQGYPDAQNDIASLLVNGMGGPKDAQMATLWYERAAEQHHPEGQFNLALRYLHGDGVAEDPETAAMWLWRAMSQHHVEATCELGTLYRFGRGVTQSYKVAGCLHLLAAKGGDPVAYGNLCDYHDEVAAVALAGDLQSALVMAEINALGIGVNKDPIEGLAWALAVGTSSLPFEEDDDAERQQHAELLCSLQADLSSEDQNRARERCEEIVGQLHAWKAKDPPKDTEIDLTHASMSASMVATVSGELMTLTDNATYIREEEKNVSMPFYTSTALQQILAMIDQLVVDTSAIIELISGAGGRDAGSQEDPRLLIDQTKARMGLLRTALDDIVQNLSRAMRVDHRFSLAWMLISESSVNMFHAIKSICVQLATIEHAVACPSVAKERHD